MNAKLLSLLTAALSTTLWASSGFLGVELRDVNANTVDSLQLPAEHGARIMDVMPDSAAETAGLQKDDVIIGYNEQRVEGVKALQRMVQETPAERKVRFSFIRGGEVQTGEAILGEAPTRSFHHGYGGRGRGGFDLDDFLGKHPWMNPHGPQRGQQDEEGDADFPLPPDAPKLGIGVQPLSPQLAGFLGLEAGAGLWVGSVDPEGRGAEAGLQEHDVVLRLAGEDLRHARDITRGLVMNQGEDISIEILRKGEAKTLTLKAADVEETQAAEADEDVL